MRFWRTMALIVALICLGISGGVTLNHTDDMGSLLRFHVGNSTVSHANAGSNADMCLACQWENSLFNPHVPAVPVVRLPLAMISLLFAEPQTRFPNPFDHTSPRAPPRFS